ncbi:MAG: hypothetical protein K0Q47_859 [Sedimentibacter sp.]|jgi:hypothetical protein|nr:hypothetical protein [Sedimentibacter sp.]
MIKKTFIVIMIAMLLIATACSKETSTPEKPVEEAVPSEENEPDEVEIIDSEDTVDKTEEDDPNKVVSPLDGLKYFPEQLKNRPVAVSIDNHPDARWQAGLSQAEIIYEFEVEYPYTRYLCIFLTKEPEMIGPVRSARPYIIYYAMENDGIFVHVGGSEDAFSEIDRLNCPEVDGLYSGAMWRYYDTGKAAPHNMYTTVKSIRDEAASYGYRTEGNFEGYLFNEKPQQLSKNYKDTLSAKNINITYNKNNTTVYEYDENNEVYLRSKDGQKHVDELDNKQLSAKNIIVLETKKSVLDSSGRLYLGTVGEGRALYITNGEAVEITWSKNKETARTKFYSGNEEIKLNPGNTWIQVVNYLDNVSIE